MAIGIQEGTQTFLKSTTVGTTEVSHVQIEGGTVGLVSVLAKGTIAVGTVSMTTGTMNGGTLSNLNFGTVDSFYRHPDEFATVVSTGTSTLGTLKAAVSGSAIYITDLTVSAGTATNFELGNGGTATPILGTLHLDDLGGAVMNFRTPIRTSAGSALVYKQSVDGPLTITAQGYVD